jgi:hypothetical protein
MFEMAGGTATSGRITQWEAASLAELGVVGAGVPLTAICQDELPSPVGAQWFRATAYDDFVLVTQGVTISDLSGLGGDTSLGYYSMVGPRDSFDALAHEVFVRILFQLYPDPVTNVTPTPTP